MKKNFLKKLASVLSLALVVSSITPAASASAAATPNLAKRYANVYEGKSYAYTVKDAKGYTVKWSVSGAGAEYVNLSAKTGAKTTVTVDTDAELAAKNKNATVKASFYKGGKLVKSAGDVIKVKVSATGLGIVAADADVKLDAIPAGEVVDFNRTITPANATSITTWSVTDKDGNATTDANVDGTGNFKADKVGEYVVKAVTSNVKGGKALATAEQAVKVVVAIKDVKQTKVNKVVVTFGADASKLVTKDNLTIVNDKKVKQVVKSVSFDAAGTTATVETYLEFAKDVVYTVSYDKSSADFTARKGDVTTVVVTGKEVAVNEKTEITVTLFDENGIDITTDDLLKKVELTTDKGWIDGNSAVKKEITLFNVGDVATVTATYKTGTYTNGVENKVVSEKAMFTSVKEIAVNGSLTAYTLSTGTPDWTKTNTTIPLNASYNAYVKVKDAASGDIIESQYTPGKFTFESTDSNVLLVYSDGSVYGVKAGTAYVKVTYGKTVEMFAVTVGEKSKAASISVDKAYATLSSSTVNGFQDTITFKVTTKDQYGNEMNSNVSVDGIELPTGGSFGAPATSGDTVTITYVAGSFTDKDGYKLKLKKDDLVVVVNVDVKAPSETTIDANTSVRLDLSATDVDMKYTKAGEAKAITITPYYYAKNGVRIDVASLSSIEIKDKDDKAITTSATADNNGKVDTTTGKVVFDASYLAGRTLEKAKTGVYKVTAKIGATSKASATFELKDTQVLPVVKIDKTVTADTRTTVTSGAGLTVLVKNAVNELFTVKFAGNDTDQTIVDVDYNVASNFVNATKSYNVFIKSVTVYSVAADGSNVPCVVPVNAYITISGN